MYKIVEILNVSDMILIASNIFYYDQRFLNSKNGKHRAVLIHIICMAYIFGRYLLNYQGK